MLIFLTYSEKQKQDTAARVSSKDKIRSVNVEAKIINY